MMTLLKCEYTMLAWTKCKNNRIYIFKANTIDMHTTIKSRLKARLVYSAQATRRPNYNTKLYTRALQNATCINAHAQQIICK